MSGVYSRQRTESSQSIDAISDTPADELSSWLGDDVCANCGISVHAGQLYCSFQCREEDASAAAFASQSGQSPKAAGISPTGQPMQASTSAPPLASNRDKSNKTSIASDVHGERFRYPCPPSPNLLAKYGAAALTSPALTALEKSLPKEASSRGRTRHPRSRADGCSNAIGAADIALETHSTSSGEESVGPALHSGNQSSTRRSSSRSTYSSTSDALSTDPSTPSPAFAAAHYRSEVDDWEPSDFHLPPSVNPISTLPLKSKSKEARQSPKQQSLTSPSFPRKSPTQRAQVSASGFPPISQSAHHRTEGANGGMHFARRPSTTNLPPPVLFTSPVLATTIKSIKRRSGGFINAATSKPSQSRSINHFDSQATLTKRMLQDAGQPLEKPSHIASFFSRPTVDEEGFDTEGDERNPCLSVHSKTKHTFCRPSWSPPQLASASSSAGKTLKALSPMSGATTPLPQAICGRFGCKGSVPFNEERCETSEGSLEVKRPSISRGHKHTHSAFAGLNIHRLDTPSTSKPSSLLMTPFEYGNSFAKQVPSFEEETNHFNDAMSARDTDRKGSVAAKPQAKPAAVDDIEQRPTPPRGRSRARGRRSTSRRSPSPPRGAARRGRSEGLAICNAPFSSSPVTNHSSPVAISEGDQIRGRGLGRARSEGGESLSQAASASLVGQRSPAERGRQLQKRLPSMESREGCESVGKAALQKRVSEDAASFCEMAWPGYGHDLDAKTALSNGFSGPVTVMDDEVAAGAGGYDDVDLDEL